MLHGDRAACTCTRAPAAGRRQQGFSESVFSSTRGTYAYGIQGRYSGDGNINISTDSNHTITTTGDNGHGIVAYHFGTMDSRTMAVRVDGTVEPQGADAHGVLVGTVDSMGEPERVAELDAEGYRRQTVTVNGSVHGGSGHAAGVFLAGGGRVYSGPQGTDGADELVDVRAGRIPAARGDTGPAESRPAGGEQYDWTPWP